MGIGNNNRNRTLSDGLVQFFKFVFRFLLFRYIAMDSKHPDGFPLFVAHNGGTASNPNIMAIFVPHPEFGFVNPQITIQKIR